MANQVKITWPNGQTKTMSLSSSDMNKTHKVSITGAATSSSGASAGLVGRRGVNVASTVLSTNANSGASTPTKWTLALNNESYFCIIRSTPNGLNWKLSLPWLILWKYVIKTCWNEKKYMWLFFSHTAFPSQAMSIINLLYVNVF